MSLLTTAVAFVVLAQPAGSAEARTAGPAWFVTSERELQAAADASQRGDVTIFIDRRIELSRMLSFPDSRSTVRLIGVGEQAALHLNRSFHGSAERIQESIANGIEFRCRQAYVANLEVFGFEMQGSAIKSYTDELLSVVNCQFHDIGMKEYPYRGGKARSAEDSVYTQCVGAHQLRRCRIEIIGCKFVRCCANTWQWSHCLYLSARSILVADCTFSDCGNPFGVGEREVRGEIMIIGNRIEKPRSARDPNGRVLQAFLCSIVGTDSFVFTRNTVSGDWLCGWTGSPDPKNNVIDKNDYGGMNYSSAWAANTSVGKYIEWNEWLAIGFDTHSKPPVRRSATPGKQR